MQIQRVIGMQGRLYPNFGGCFVLFEGKKKDFLEDVNFKLGIEKWVEGSQLKHVIRGTKEYSRWRKVMSHSLEIRAWRVRWTKLTWGNWSTGQVQKSVQYSWRGSKDPMGKTEAGALLWGQGESVAGLQWWVWQAEIWFCSPNSCVVGRL